MTWFTKLENIAYAVVEYIPGAGTYYSFSRAHAAYKEHEKQKFWQSVVNCVQGAVRDIVIITKMAEPIPAVVVHTMAESFTDKMAEVWNEDPVIKINANVKKDDGHVLIAESSQGKYSNEIFGGKAKGVFHFYGAVFIGTLTEPTSAPRGVKIRMDIPQGLYDGAPVLFSWRWASPNTPAATFGIIRLKEGTESTPTEFELSYTKDAGLTVFGYHFSGKIKSKDQIIAKTYMDRRYIEIDFRRANEISTTSVHKI